MDGVEHGWVVNGVSRGSGLGEVVTALDGEMERKRRLWGCVVVMSRRCVDLQLRYVGTVAVMTLGLAPC